MNCKKCDRLQAEVDELWRYGKRAEKAEKERDELRSLYEGQIEVIGRLQRDAAESRPLTPDAITEAGTSRFIYSVRDAGYDAVMRIPYRVLMDGMHAALTEPPKRPEGAEDIEALIRDAENAGEGADNEALANYLAARLTDPTRKEA